MKSTEFIVEARTAPLYHFTSLTNLQSIVKSNTLKGARDPKKALRKMIGGENTSPMAISFTRDFDRDWLAGYASMVQGWGLRFDQMKLHNKFGKLLKSDTGEKAETILTMKSLKASDNEYDQKTYNNVMDAIKKGDPTPLRGSGYGGARLTDLYYGLTVARNRFESEERLEVDQIDNVMSYVTGIVISKNYKIGYDVKTEADLAKLFIDAIGKHDGYNNRNWMIEIATQLNIPLIYNRKEYNANNVKSLMIQYFTDRKTDKEVDHPDMYKHHTTLRKDREARNAEYDVKQTKVADKIKAMNSKHR